MEPGLIDFEFDTCVSVLRKSLSQIRRESICRTTIRVVSADTQVVSLLLDRRFPNTAQYFFARACRIVQQSHIRIAMLAIEARGKRMNRDVDHKPVPLDSLFDSCFNLIAIWMIEPPEDALLGLRVKTGRVA